MWQGVCLFLQCLVQHVHHCGQSMLVERTKLACIFRMQNPYVGQMSQKSLTHIASVTGNWGRLSCAGSPTFADNLSASHLPLSKPSMHSGSRVRRGKMATSRLGWFAVSQAACSFLGHWSGRGQIASTGLNDCWHTHNNCMHVCVSMFTLGRYNCFGGAISRVWMAWSLLLTVMT